MIWHGGFPLLMLGYALAERRGGGGRYGDRPAGPSWAASWQSSLRFRPDLIVTSGRELLPILLQRRAHTRQHGRCLSAVCSLSLAALLVLLLRRPHSVLDIWLMVVLCAWLFDIALSAIVNVARFDLGFYAGRFYELCAATFVLAVLLIDNIGLQSQLSGLLGRLRRQAASERDRHRERERLFSAAVESSNDAIITKSLDGTITGWNPAAERLFGYTAAEAVGSNIDIIVPPDRTAEVQRHPARGSAGAKRSSNTRRCGCARTAGRWRSRSASPRSRRRRDAIIGASKTARDITESKRDRAGASPADRGAPPHLRNLPGPDPGDRSQGQFWFRSARARRPYWDIGRRK